MPPPRVPADDATTPTGPALRLTGLVRTYGHHDADRGTGVRAVDGVDLDLPTGSFTAVMGPSGSGKSTLLACAAGLDRPDAGDVEIGGVSIAGWSEARLARFRREHVGFVFQRLELVPYLTAAQNVSLPLRLARRRVRPTAVLDALDRVGLRARSDDLPAHLSGGQQQRVAVARALLARPDVLLADEPTGALDTVSAREVLGLLRTTVDLDGGTVMMVTHDPVAAAFADAVVFLVDGRIVGRMHHPSAEAVATQLAHLDDLVSTAPRPGAAA